MSLRRWQDLSPDERLAVGALRVSARQVEYAGTIERAIEACRDEDDDDIAGIAILDGADIAGFLVLKRGTRAPAWADARAATISALRIDESRQGCGLGAAALRALPAWIAEHWPASTALTLSVDEENLSARAAYERAGFVDHGHREAGRIGWVRTMSRAMSPDTGSHAQR